MEVTDQMDEDPLLEAREQWIEPLGSPDHPGHHAAVGRLHAMMLRAARHQVHYTTSAAGRLGHSRIEEVVNAAADEATTAVLARLDTFQGRSAFTTWAYKFAIMHTAVELRRLAWRERDVSLDMANERRSVAPLPEQLAEAADLSSVLGRALDTALTAHQRRVAIALMVEQVPIDVLAERLETSRNALYKTLHDVRVRLRADLAARGYLAAVAPKAVN